MFHIKRFAQFSSIFPMSFRFQLHHGNDIPMMLNSIFNGICGIVTVFIICELCQRMADGFVKIEITIEQFHWYLFPIEIQRMLPVIIAVAQQPVTLECFGSIACTRDVFKDVRLKQTSQ